MCWNEEVEKEGTARRHAHIALPTPHPSSVRRQVLTSSCDAALSSVFRVDLMGMQTSCAARHAANRPFVPGMVANAANGHQARSTPGKPENALHRPHPRLTVPRQWPIARFRDFLQEMSARMPYHV